MGWRFRSGEEQGFLTWTEPGGQFGSKDPELREGEAGEIQGRNRGGKAGRDPGKVSQGMVQVRPKDSHQQL